MIPQWELPAQERIFCEAGIGNILIQNVEVMDVGVWHRLVEVSIDVEEKKEHENDDEGYRQEILLQGRYLHAYPHFEFCLILQAL
jgi:hypothetical protein